MTGLAFANAVWTMTLGALGWIVFATVSADKMEKVQKKFFCTIRLILNTLYMII